MKNTERMRGTTVKCKNCQTTITEDDNGAGGKVWVHSFGSTVCYDDPPGSREDGSTTTVAEPEMTAKAEAILPGATIKLARQGSAWTVLEVRHQGEYVFLTVRSPVRQRVVSFPKGADVPATQPKDH